MFKFIKNLLVKKDDAVISNDNPKINDNLALKIASSRIGIERNKAPYKFEPPVLPKGIIDEKIAMDSGMAMDSSIYDYINTVSTAGMPFMGYPALAQLATRSEYRAMASALSTELTREWIELTSSNTEDGTVKEKISQIEAEMKRLKVKEIFQKTAELDCLYGRGQIFIDIKGHERHLPLVLSPKTVAIGSLHRISSVEAMWTSPLEYNALDPAAPDFYKPTSWFMIGSKVHASRLMTIITRPLPDMLKPAFNFSGISLSQLAEPYVENWLRTRQSVSNLIDKFSITMLSTDLSQLMQVGLTDTEASAAADSVLSRLKLFTQTRSNMGMVAIDKTSEEIVQVNTPLGGLHELQSQAQEQMCAVSRMPAIILTGISPSGLNASSEGELRSWNDWIAAQQEAYWSEPLETILKVIQLSLFGEIDDTISFTWKQLQQANKTEEAAIRLSDAQTASAYLDRGVLSPEVVLEKLARDADSGYHGIDITIEPMNEGEESLTDNGKT